MANNRFNKQVTPKGYKKGGRVGKMGGGMMKRPMMKQGGVTKPLKDPIADYVRSVKEIRKPKGAKRLGKMGGGMMMKRPMMKKGGPLKPVDPKTQKGLSKLPTKVRNKMGYMKDGGKVKKVKPLGKKPKPGTYDYYLLNRPKHSPAPIKPKPKKG